MIDALYTVLCGGLAGGVVVWSLSAVMPQCRTTAEQEGRNFATGCAGIFAASLVGLLVA